MKCVIKGLHCIRMSSEFGNNKGADHLHGLISAFVICLKEMIISKLATSKIAIVQGVSVAEQANFGMTRP